jgi:hypothetical protein
MLSLAGECPQILVKYMPLYIAEFHFGYNRFNWTLLERR